MNLRHWLIGLLVANLLVFAWTNWIDIAPSPPGEIVVPPSIANNPVTPPVSQEATPAVRRCVSVGPFRNTTETSEAIDAFRAASYEPQSRAQTATINDGFWVYVDSPRSAAEQRRTLAQIRRAGIEDVSALPGSAPPYKVSVGTFSDRDRAERRAQRVRELNIEAKVEPNLRSTTFYWLDMQQQPGDEELRLEVLNGAGAPPGGLTITACPAATSANE